jgi:DnaK suppressor protein
MTSPDVNLDTLIEQLEAERQQTQDELDRAQRELENVSDTDGVADSGDAAVETTIRDGLLTRISRARTHLEEVERAFARIEAGTFGRCAVDGEPIEPARLTAVPWAEYCVQHQPEHLPRGATPTL